MNGTFLAVGIVVAALVLGFVGYQSYNGHGIWIKPSHTVTVK